MRRTLKTQLMALALLPAILIILIVGGYLAYNRIQDIDEFANARAHALINQLDIASRYARSSNDLSMLQNISNASLEEKGLRSISIFDEQKKPLIHSGVKLDRFLATQEHLQDHPVSFNSQDLLIFTAPMASSFDNHNGWIVVAYQRDIFIVKRYEAWLLQNIILLALLILTAVAGNWLAGRLIHDIHQLRDYVNQLRNGNTPHPPAINTSQELNLLSDDVNRMCTQLNNDIDELRYNIELATSDLKSTIETMEIQNIELTLMQKEAVTASRIKSEFLANTSHEIRTPLNGIIGFTRILKRTPLNTQQLDYLETIEQSSQGLLAIINDILDFSKIEAGKLELDESLFDIQQCCEEVVSLFAPSSYEKNLELVLLIYRDVPQQLVGDAMRIRQVLSNLVSNAIKFTHTGSIVIRVAVEQQDDSHAVLSFSVTDSGIGMSSEQQKHLFHAFSQANTSISREYGGTGLGLAIVRKLVDLMQGDIRVDSTLQQGSTFTFTIRLRTSRKNTPPQTPDLSGKSILVIEPSTVSATAIRQILEQWQVNVQLAADFHSAEPLLSLHYFDAIIYCPDLHFSLNNFLKEAAQLQKNCAQPLLLLLPPGHEKYSQELEKHGFSVSFKPVTRPRLYKAICMSGNNVPGTEKAGGNTARQVLAVDDQPTNLKLLEVLLADMGISLTTATDGYQAIQRCREQRFDLILMDIQMPGMSGTEACQHIRSNSLNCTTPVIAVTAHALADEKQRLLAAGMNDYISKPVNEEQLAGLFNSRVNDNTDIVDVAASLKLAHGKTALAIDLFTSLMEQLPDNMKEIMQYYRQSALNDLLDAVHKLHGICCYTGVPQLKQAVQAIEQTIKSTGKLPDDRLINQLETAAEQVLQWHLTQDFNGKLAGL